MPAEVQEEIGHPPAHDQDDDPRAPTMKVSRKTVKTMRASLRTCATAAPAWSIAGGSAGGSGAGEFIAGNGKQKASANKSQRLFGKGTRGKDYFFFVLTRAVGSRSEMRGLARLDRRRGWHRRARSGPSRCSQLAHHRRS